ncbi:hypothetical protein PF010_g13219 [Phytophthora fragariae]|uniref:Uncharacterized protein n=1 Tax=Phytophthora fragariae TaxID=53985 RepID=A0A6G0L1B2_9STRA|nr:hypothetical protein PF010_g13219 [Phytophthora fragariae]
MQTYFATWVGGTSSSSSALLAAGGTGACIFSSSSAASASCCSTPSLVRNAQIVNRRRARSVVLATRSRSCPGAGL